MATKAELEAQLAERDREPVLISFVIAGPIMGAGGLLTVAVLYMAAQKYGGVFSPYWLAVPGVVAWLIAHSEGAAYFPPQRYGYGPQTAARLLAALAGAAAVCWLVWTGRQGPGATWPLLLLGTMVVALLWWALLWWSTRRLRDPGPTVTASPDATVDQGMPWPRLLERATDGTVVLTDVKYHRAGAKLTVEPGRFTDDDGEEHDEDVTFDGFARCADRFATFASREYRRRTGEFMPLNCARPEAGRYDAEFVLHVTMRDVFKESSVFVPADGPQDVMKPVDLGEYEDANRILVTLMSGHAKIVGAEGSGKTNEANNWIARITECSNAIAWVCATDKLIPLIFPWLRSWFEGRAVHP
jgi:hypothetical protein